MCHRHRLWQQVGNDWIDQDLTSKALAISVRHGWISSEFNLRVQNCCKCKSRHFAKCVGKHECVEYCICVKVKKACKCMSYMLNRNIQQAMWNKSKGLNPLARCCSQIIWMFFFVCFFFQPYLFFISWDMCYVPPRALATACLNSPVKSFQRCFCFKCIWPTWNVVMGLVNE